MEYAMKNSSCGASSDGTTIMDMDGVTFLRKRLEDINVVKTMNFGSSFVLEIGSCGWRWVGWSGMEMWMVAGCGIK